MQKRSKISPFGRNDRSVVIPNEVRDLDFERIVHGKTPIGFSGMKHSLGHSDMPISGSEALGYFRQSGYRMLPVSPEHAAAVETLPTHHQYPFDRLLVAQSLTEPLRLLTHDTAVARYSDAVILI